MGELSQVGSMAQALGGVGIGRGLDTGKSGMVAKQDIACQGTGCCWWLAAGSCLSVPGRSMQQGIGGAGVRVGICALLQLQ